MSLVEEKLYDMLLREDSLEVGVKKTHENGELPVYKHPDDCGADVTAARIIEETEDHIWYGTGIIINPELLPLGFFLFPRGSISKYDLQLANSVGTIETNFRGEIQVRFNKIYGGNLIKSHFESFMIEHELIDYVDARYEDNYEHKVYEIGDKIAQLILLPVIKADYYFIDQVDETDRGEGAFGSTGQ